MGSYAQRAARIRLQRNPSRPKGFRGIDKIAVLLTEHFLEAASYRKPNRIMMTTQDKFGGSSPFLQMFKDPDPLGRNDEYRDPNLDPMGSEATCGLVEGLMLREREIFYRGVGDIISHAIHVTASSPRVVVVNEINANDFEFSRTNERGLGTVLVSLPTYLDWSVENPINVKEAQNSENRPDRLIAVLQHLQFIGQLISYGLNVIILRPHKECPEGVFTRDIAFVIGKKLIRGNMVADVRKPEQETIKNAHELPDEAEIEGGNVFVDQAGDEGIVLVGVGSRTNRTAVEYLQDLLGTDFKVIPIRIKDHVLHLDCVFNPLKANNNGDGAVLYHPNAFEKPEDVELLQKIYGRMMRVVEADMGMMPTNIVSTKRNAFFVPECPSLIALLNDIYGAGNIAIVETWLDEIMKADGSGRCSILPFTQYPNQKTWPFNQQVIFE